MPAAQDGGQSSDESTDTTDSNQDEQRRKFRDALDRKKEAPHGGPVKGARNAGVGEAHNDHTRRQFRRKSGS